MLKGIDVSSWQAGLNLKPLQGLQFCIAKATESTNYINPTCDGFVQQAIELGIPWGTYHFAQNGNAESEALFYYQNISGYIGNGICVLDYEVWNSNSVKWCEKFISKFYDLAKVWPLLYISASHCNDFKSSWIPQKCGLWVAGYPQVYTSFIDSSCPYDVSPWEFAAIWQFTDQLKLAGSNLQLDGDLAYMDTAAWAKYAGKTASSQSSKVQPKLSYHDLVLEIYLGEWGNGADRKRMLKAAGYDYETAQTLVNKYIDIAHQCVQGLWGNGWNRKTALESHGYKYDVVQAIVNKMLGA